MIEVEVKLPVQSLAEVKEFLEKHGFEKTDALLERDSYFDTSDGMIRGSDRALRIRCVKNLLTGEVMVQMNHKGPKLDQQTMTRKELEMIISDAETGHRILNALGYEVVPPEVIKNREEYKKENMTVCLDKVEGLGEFLELEILVEDADEDEKRKEMLRAEALEKIESVLRQLGYEIKDTVNISYLTMLQRRT